MSDDIPLELQLVALQALSKQVSDRFAAVKAELAPDMVMGDRLAARLPDKTRVGAVTFTEGSVTAQVVDERAFADWVADNYPDEVVPQVRGSFRAAVLAASKSAGEPMAPDGTAEVPGVRLGRSDGHLTVTVDKANLPALVAAVRSSQLLALDGEQ